MASLSVTQTYADWACGLVPASLPAGVRATAENALLDFSGLCVSARDTPYVRAALAAWDGEGSCTALGHPRGLDAAGAALLNGMAAHGEDYDDTFEGTPVHTGAVVIPAVLAACEAHGKSGAQALKGIAVGVELMCRMALVAPTAIHRAGFHPTAVIGALGATAGVGAALEATPQQMTDALGIAGSMAGGIIEYLAEGTWTKRMHPGWAAQCGIRAARLGMNGFSGPRTVLEGEHGFFFAFGAPGIEPDFHQVTARLGDQWHLENIAVKPYACGTMTQPFIDCAINLAKGDHDLEQIDRIVCKVGEGTVHRLWEPLAEKQRPTTPYSAKFSVPYCIAIALVDRAAGLSQFTEERISDPRVLGLAGRVAYEIDPLNEYPRNYSGHLRVTWKDGSETEVEQPHLRGGAREPMTREELLAKFRANVAHGGGDEGLARDIEAFCAEVFDQPGLSGLRDFQRR